MKEIIGSIVVVLGIALFVHLAASFAYLDWNWLPLTTTEDRITILALSVPVAVFFLIIIFT